MMKTWGLAMVAVFLSSLGCGDDGGDSESFKGGSCVVGSAPSESCFTVTSPEDYDVKTECGIVGGSYGAAPCNEARYARKCSEVVEIEENGQTYEATYVRYFPAGTNVVCSGTLEDL